MYMFLCQKILTQNTVIYCKIKGFGRIRIQLGMELDGVLRWITIFHRFLTEKSSVTPAIART